jgi:hypothetical protein
VLAYNPGVAVSRGFRIAGILLVVIYLCAAGWFLVLAPWSRFWALRVVQQAPEALRAWLDSPAVRGALSGFGLVHFAAAFSWLEEAASRS